MTEVKLGDLPETDADVQDTPTPETFDVGRWADGIRGVRRAALLFVDDEAIDLAVQMDIIAESIDVLPAGDQRDNLIDSYDAYRQEMIDAATRFVVEARSRERRKAVEKQARDDLKVDKGLRQKQPQKLTDDEREKLYLEEAHVMCFTIADHIIEPAGVTGEDLWNLWHVRDSEVNKLATVVSELNSQAMIDSSVVTRDFSHRRSGRR